MSDKKSLQTRLIHTDYKAPAGFAAFPASHPSCVHRAVQQCGGAAFAQLAGQVRLYLRPARHADHLHAGGAAGRDRRRARIACWRPAGWRRSRWSILALLKTGDDVLLPDNVYNPNRELGNWLAARFRHQRALLRSDDRRRHRRADPAEYAADLDRSARLGVDGSARYARPSARPRMTRGARGRARQYLVGRHRLARPSTMGVDIVMQALTKYQSGGSRRADGRGHHARRSAAPSASKLAHMRLGYGRRRGRRLPGAARPADA